MDQSPGRLLRTAWSASVVAALAAAGANAGTCVGDLDGSGGVEGADLGQLLGAWGSGDELADLDGNGTVGGEDLGLLLGAWGLCPAEACEPEWLPTFGPGHTLDGHVHASIVFDDGLGGGPALYVGGDFETAGGTHVSHIARWDGESWSALGGGVDGRVEALAVFDDGGGPALYAGGQFMHAAGPDGRPVVVNSIARWDPAAQAWRPLGEGVKVLGGYGLVHDLEVFDDGLGKGPALYVGGQFATAGGVESKHIAGWRGSWFSLDGGMTGILPRVESLAVFDDGAGDGPVLVAGGLFFTAGDVTASHIAQWDGEDWAPLAQGTGYAPVFALTVFDDGEGGGPVLIVGGAFDTAGDMTVNHIAQWDGESWAPLGEGVDQGVWALAVFDDGSGDGPSLFVGGGFLDAGDVSAPGIAKWTGGAAPQWAPLGDGVFGAVLTLTVLGEEVQGPALLAGGNFTATDSGDMFIARWGCLER